MSKKFLILILVITMLSGCNIFSKQPTQTPGQQELGISERMDVITESTDNHDIEANYPVFTTNDKELEQKINNVIKTQVDTIINNYKMSEQQEGDVNFAELRGTLNMDYVIGLVNDKIISLYFEVYVYAASAAHGFTYYEPINYDIKNNKNIRLTDVFKVNSDYLMIISDKAKIQFNEQFTEIDWFVESVEPDVKNFENFILTKQAIIFLFSDYAVAPYVAGPQTLVVDYKGIDKVVEWEGVMGGLK